MQVPYYNVHKIMQGLLDQHVILGNEKAFPMVVGMADYFYKRIDTLITQNGTDVWERVLDTETGGMNDVMYQLYSLTNRSTHLRMAHLFDKAAWFDGMLNGTDILANHHANTHLALSVGGAQRYAITGDASYKHATEFFAKTLQIAHSYSTGGSNYREYWNAAHQQGASLLNINDNFAGHDNEESCTTYNFLKILSALYTWSGDPNYLSMYTYALNNGVLGIQKGPNAPGVMIYLLPLGTGVTKGNSSRGWGTPFNSFWCCYGTGIESFAKLADSIYFKRTGKVGTDGYLGNPMKGTANKTDHDVRDGGGGMIDVARYVSSTLATDEVGLKQEANMAWNGTATCTITTAPKGAMTINFLVPAWTEVANGVAPSIDGYTGDALKPGAFYTVSRSVFYWFAIELLT
jgi:DUF1680 family protein